MEHETLVDQAGTAGVRAGAARDQVGSAGVRAGAAERQARAEWLIAEFRRRAAACEDPREQANLLRSADSLVRLATANQS